MTMSKMTTTKVEIEFNDDELDEIVREAVRTKFPELFENSQNKTVDVKYHFSSQGLLMGATATVTRQTSEDL